jgi:hypothetical protein
VASHLQAINILKQSIESIEKHQNELKAKNKKKRLKKQAEKEQMRLRKAGKPNIIADIAKN